MVSVFPVRNRSANQKVKNRIVRGRDSPAHISFIRGGISEEKLSLRDELFRKVCNNVADLIYEIQVRMQSDFIGANQAKKIHSNAFSQLL